MYKHNPDITEEVRFVFPRLVSGHELFNYFCENYLEQDPEAQHEQAEHDLEKFTFITVLSDTEAQIRVKVLKFYATVARLDASRQGTIKLWAKKIVNKLPQQLNVLKSVIKSDLESKLCSRYDLDSLALSACQDLAVLKAMSLLDTSAYKAFRKSPNCFLYLHSEVPSRRIKLRSGLEL